jgi:DNA-binding NarL/FixJ family response regulator
MTPVDDTRVEVVLVEDDPKARAWLESGIRGAAALDLVASFAALRPASAWFARRDADVLLTDLALPDGHGLSLIADVAARTRADGSARTDVLVISVFGDEETVLQCVEAGAVGYIHKDDSPENIASIILDVRRGASPISPMIARGLLSRFRDRAKARRVTSKPGELRAPEVDLTPAESDVLAMIARGYTYAEIGRERGVSINTVQSQIKVLYSKLAVHSRGEAVFTATQLGLIDPFDRT